MGAARYEQNTHSYIDDQRTALHGLARVFCDMPPQVSDITLHLGALCSQGVKDKDATRATG